MGAEGARSKTKLMFLEAPKAPEAKKMAGLIAPKEKTEKEKNEVFIKFCSTASLFFGNGKNKETAEKKLGTTCLCLIMEECRVRLTCTRRARLLGRVSGDKKRLHALPAIF